MKRLRISREALAHHEAGHLVAIAMLERPMSFSWRRLKAYEIAHAEVPAFRSGNWDNADDRNLIIACNAVIALAGGAADLCAAGRAVDAAPSPAEVHSWTGPVDFELAHEWLTLQRYDGDQGQIEADHRRLFVETYRMLAMPKQRAALPIIAGRIIELLRTADQSCATSLEVPAHSLVRGIELDAPPRFMLRSTIAA
jgi:hypothetical protein